MGPARQGGPGNTHWSIVSNSPLIGRYFYFQNAPGVYYKLYYKKKDEISFKITKTKEMRRLGNVGLYTVRVDLKDYWTPFIVKIQVDKIIGFEYLLLLKIIVQHYA